MHVYTQGTPWIEHGFKTLFSVNLGRVLYLFFAADGDAHMWKPKKLDFGQEKAWCGFIGGSASASICFMMRGFRNMVCCNGKIVSLDDDYSQHINMRYPLVN
jgi:hypothetical protein